MIIVKKLAAGCAAVVLAAVSLQTMQAPPSPASEGVRIVAASSTAAADTKSYMQLLAEDANISASAFGVGDTNGTLDVPANVSQLAWYNKSAQFADQVGTITVAGHVSDNSDKPGALFNLKNLKVGDKIKLVKAGETRVFQISKREFFSRDGLLPQRLFPNDVPLQLVIVTCANKETYPNGSFHYKDNLVVTATLVK